MSIDIFLSPAPIPSRSGPFKIPKGGKKKVIIPLHSLQDYWVLQNIHWADPVTLWTKPMPGWGAIWSMHGRKWYFDLRLSCIILLIVLAQAVLHPHEVILQTTNSLLPALLSPLSAALTLTVPAHFSHHLWSSWNTLMNCFSLWNWQKTLQCLLQGFVSVKTVR